jgi:pyruvate,orthophosphate dikinase
LNSSAIPAQPPLSVVLDGTCALTREEIGGKAWGINRMQGLRLPVPPAFVVTTHACREYFASNREIGDRLWSQIAGFMGMLEAGSGRRFGATRRPLLVSVRSGAAHSMPGMMDTVLNLGINLPVEAALAAESGDAAYAADTHRRFVAQYRKVVLGGRSDPVPADPWAQLRNAVASVFDSWNSPRARVYRSYRGLSDESGTAVTIQAMVFGNLDASSGTGVLFSRNPITGEGPPWGEWLIRGQGEDVVSGGHTPQTVDALRGQLPAVHAELMRAAATLEGDARDIQDIEFTVESGRLWLLQTRVAKRSPQAAVRAAVAFAEGGLLSKEEAVRRLRSEQVRELPVLQLAQQAARQPPVAIGEAACPGVAGGWVVTNPEEAEDRAARGEQVILARANTSPEDLHGIIASRGLMTEQGGATSHAAVVSRELGRPCVVGCGSSTVTALAGQWVTLDGGSGRVWTGNLAVEQASEIPNGDLSKLVEWGMPLIPIRLLKADAAAADIVDLDALGENWRAALKPGIAVRGRILETDTGIRAAMDARVGAALVRHRLPALLACLQGVGADSNVGPTWETSVPAPAAHLPELSLLRLLGLKGRAALDILADSLSTPSNAVAADYMALCQQGLCSKTGEVLRLNPAGKDRLAALLDGERERADPAAVLSLYEEFCVFNAELKQIMTTWQVRGDGTPNDHLESGYDDAVLGRLSELHARAAPVLQRLEQLSPRLAIYPVRLSRALERIAAGDRSYVARLIADSYHTVWYELHKELISLAGLNHDSEARTGRAT